MSLLCFECLPYFLPILWPPFFLNYLSYFFPSSITTFFPSNIVFLPCYLFCGSITSFIVFFHLVFYLHPSCYPCVLPHFLSLLNCILPFHLHQGGCFLFGAVMVRTEEPWQRSALYLLFLFFLCSLSVRVCQIHH